MSDWLEIYRAYTADELTAEMASLRKSLAGGFVSQGSGSVSHQRDLADLRDRLRAATRVQNERKRTLPPRRMIADFSDLGRSTDEAW